MAHQFDDLFSGKWISWLWYPSKDDSSEEVTKNRMIAHQMGHELLLESQKNVDESYMLIRLTVDDNLATGVWHETASPTGDFKGTMYSGAGQLIISDDNNHIEGKWAGLGFDQKLQKPRIYTGHWELAREVDGKEPQPNHKSND